MDIKTLQSELKKKNVKATQVQINSILQRLSIVLELVNVDNLADTLTAIESELNSSGKMSVYNAISKKERALSVPTPEETADVDESELNATKQSATNASMGEKLLSTADALSERNLEMAKVMPMMVRNMTISKLRENAVELQSSWNDVNDELSEIIFGL